MITPAYQNAKKANELVSDVSTGRVTEVEPRECWGLLLLLRGDTGMLRAALTGSHAQTSLRVKWKQNASVAPGPDSWCLLELLIDFEPIYLSMWK